MNATLPDRLKIWLASNDLDDFRYLLAVSGGADSVALLRSFHELDSKASQKFLVAHFNHRLRGEDSDEDERFVQKLCEERDLAVEVGHWDRTEQTNEQTVSEEFARKERYKFLQQVAERHRSSFIVTAHTADDQVETILHHIIRGTGFSGLVGIAARRPLTDRIELVRPFLDVTRKEIEDYLRDIGQNYRTDATNFQCKQTRSKLRHDLLPLLRNEFNPQIDRALRRLGTQASQAEQFLREYSEKILDAAILDLQAEICRLDCSLLQNHPPLIVRECLRLLWEKKNWPRQQMGFEEWQRLNDLVHSSGIVSLPHRIRAQRRENLLILTRSEK